MQLEGLIACICEGSAERAILDILLDNNMLLFEREDLLDEDLLRCRNARTFEDRYLRKGFKEKITVLRILDSKGEKFKLRKAYENKVKVINVITAPEIEMLVIINEGKYKDYKNKQTKLGMNPSDYCKQVLKLGSVKSYDYMEKYFSDANNLVDVIKEYKRVSKIGAGEQCLADLLKSAKK